MESEYYGGDQSDDGGATPVQDERDSGSDVEDEGNEQHSGSENGSVGHHSEEQVSMWTRSRLRFLNGICSSSEEVLASRSLHHEKGGNALIQRCIWGRAT